MSIVVKAAPERNDVTIREAATVIRTARYLKAAVRRIGILPFDEVLFVNSEIKVKAVAESRRVYSLLHPNGSRPDLEYARSTV